MASKLAAGQKVKVGGRANKEPYKATVIRVEGAMALVKDEKGMTKLVPLRDVIPSD
jgi:hypothetical protein